MPDLLQIVNDYFVEQIEKSRESRIVVKIPADLVKHIIKFYLSPYLNDLEVLFEKGAVKAKGVNVFPIQIKVSVESIEWKDEEKLIKLFIDTNEMVLRFIEVPLSSLEQRLRGIVARKGNYFIFDVEKVFRLNPKWHSITFALRNKVKLSEINLELDAVELIFEIIKP